MSAARTLPRLAAMSPLEIAHRARIALRDHVAPPAWTRWSPERAGERLFVNGATAAWRESRLGRWVGAPARGEMFDATRAAARALAAGRWSLFGRPVTLDDPPRWNRNPLTGAEWPDRPSSAIDYRRADLAGGAKGVWEAGRLTMLPTLALAARLDRDRALATLAARWLDDWTARNPLGHGIHHTSGIEMALRVMTGCWTLALLGEDAAGARLDSALGLMAQQALYCHDHLSLGSSANNHLIAEFAAMATLAAAFPALRESNTLLDDGLAGLERETLRQFHEDGVGAEQAFGYLPFVWELLLIPFIAAGHAGREVSAAVRERLIASLEFARAMRLPDGGWPRIGDEDDGRVLLAEEGPGRLDRVGNALAAWLDAPALSDDDPVLALLLVGRLARPARAASDGRHDFASGGCTVWRERGLLLTFDHGPLGLGTLAAHGHADALAITLFRGTEAIVVDPGTLAYHDDPAARDRCRATPAHATVHFGGRSQSEMLGPFLWGRRARVHAADAWRCEWTSGEWHERAIEVAADRVVIRDRVAGVSPELVFPLAPGAEVTLDGPRATLTTGGTRATFEGEGIDGWRLEPAEVAPRFGWRVPSHRLAARITGDKGRTTITLGAR